MTDDITPESVGARHQLAATLAEDDGCRLLPRAWR